MRLPEYSPNQVEPNLLPTPHVSGAAPVAVGMERFGASLSSGEIAELARQAKAKADAAVVQGAVLDFSKKAMALQTEALSKKGHEALNFDQYNEKFNNLLGEFRATLKNQNQLYAFNQHTAHIQVNFGTDLIRHANIEGDAIEKKNATEMVPLKLQDLANHAFDDSQYDVNNPQSLIRQVQAAEADRLFRVDGLSNNDPAFEKGIKSVTSKAYTDRVKLLMTERPSEANDFFKKHESEIDPQQREALAKSVSHLGDEQVGVGLAMEKLDDIKAGRKTETELTQEGYAKLKDKPAAFKVYQAELNHLYAQNRADQITSTAVIGGKIETAIEKIEEKRIVSLSDLKGIPEVAELERLADTNKVAATELERVKRYVTQSRRAQKTEIHQAQVEARSEAHFAAWLKSDKERKQKESKDDFMLSMRDPETIVKMTEADIIQAGRDHGLKYSQVKGLLADRLKAIKDSSDPSKLHNRHISTTLMNTVLDRAGIGKDDREGFGKAWRAAIAQKETELKRPLTEKEIEEGGLMGLQSHARSTWLGLGKQVKVWDMPTEKKPGTKGAIPSEVIHPKGGKGKLDAASARLFLGQVGWDGKARPTQKQKDEAAAMAKQQGFEVE